MGVPALLEPLKGESRVIEGGDDALRVSIALREALQSDANCVLVRARPGFALAQVSTVEGYFSVRAYDAGFMARLMPGRFCESGKQWRSLWDLAENGVPCARPIGVLSARGVNCLVVERPANTTALDVWLARERAQLQAQPSRFHAFIAGLATLVASLHRAGGVIRDLRPSQIAVRAPRPGTEKFEFFLLEAGDEPPAGRVSEAARLANLGEFALSFQAWPATAKLRFFREYRGLIGGNEQDRSALRIVIERARLRSFDIRTLLVAHCAEPSPGQAVVERDGVTLLLNRTVENAGLEELEQPLGSTAPEQWDDLVTRHFESRLGNGALCRIVSPIKAGDPNLLRRIEGIWGRLLELESVDARTPRPLACVIARDMVVTLGRVNGRLEPLAAHKHDRDWRLVDELAHELALLHGAGLYFLPGEPNQLMSALNAAISPSGQSEFLLNAPDQLFRGAPSQLGTQAVASLGRVARALQEGMGERATKELVWAYARVLRLNSFDTQMLVEEAARVPSGRTLVMTRGIEKSRVARGVKS